MAISSNRAHVLIIPYPAPGHMLPLLDLTNQLATRGLEITVLVTPKNLFVLDSILTAHPRIHTLVLPFPAQGAENVEDVPPTGIPAIMIGLRQLYEPVVHWFNNHPSPPSAIISDMFLWWTNKLACQLGIPRYMFSTSGFMAMSIIYSLHRYPPPESTNFNCLVEMSKVPNSPIYPLWQLLFLYSTSYKEGDPISEFLRDGVIANMASYGLIFNSFDKLERVYLDHVMREAGHDRVWSVGPLLLTEESNNPSGPPRGPDSSSDNEILSWLNMCQDQTVVYVCFGTQAILTNTQVESIANGLEKSGVKFIWRVVKRDPLGPGYEDHVAGRGLIVKKWAPQKKILSHRAVGAFLTHCGWNSVLEALVGEVPMLTWPIEGEQFLNANFIVDELKVGMRVSEGALTVPDSDDVARVLAEAVGENKSERVKEMRLRAMKLSEVAVEATREGGSSYEDLDRLVAHISQEKEIIGENKMVQ